jgi:hypothetical protein
MICIRVCVGHQLGCPSSHTNPKPEQKRTLIASIGYMTVCSYPSISPPSSFLNNEQNPMRSRVCERGVPLCRQMRPRPYSGSGRSWAGGPRSYFARGQQTKLESGAGGSYSYSSTGATSGWAIMAAAIGPPPYVFGCRARMPALTTITREERAIEAPKIPRRPAG